MRQIVTIEDELEFIVEPYSRVRRTFHFPIFTEMVPTRFRLRMKRMAAARGRTPQQAILDYHYGGKKEDYCLVAIPPLEVGETQIAVLPSMFAPGGGTVLMTMRQDSVVANWNRALEPPPEYDIPLYSYHLFRSDQVFLAVIGPLVALTLMVAGALIDNKTGFPLGGSNNQLGVIFTPSPTAAAALIPTSSLVSTPGRASTPRSDQRQEGNAADGSYRLAAYFAVK